MYGRLDLVDAHTFLGRRVAAAVLRSDPDGIDLPLRRTSLGLRWGLLVAAVAVIVVVVLNVLVFRGDDAWRSQGSMIVVEQETGARYLVIDGNLHPVANVTSAALIIGAPPTVKMLSAASLADVPRGPALGIAGLPDALPAPTQLQDSIWMACAQDGGVSLTVAADDAGAGPVPETNGVLARVGGEVFLVWNGTRSRVTQDWAARAIGLEPTSAREVDPAWLNVFPSAPDLGLPPFTIGGGGPVVAGQATVLGQIIEVAGGNANRPFVVGEAGLVPVTPVVAALLAAAPDTGLPPAIVVAEAEFAQHVSAPAPVWQTQFPADPLTPLADDTVPCARWGDGATSLVASPPVAGDPTVVAPGTTSDARTAGHVQVAPGAGRLLTTAPAPGVPGAGMYLLSETGAKYPVANAQSATAIGLSAEAAQPVPAEWLALLPTGPTILQTGSG